MADLDALSLHQLKVLLLLLEERSVSAAARRLGVTQPAVSHALRALRELLGDPLLVAGARGMAPTPRAVALTGPLRRTVREIETLLRGGADFDLASVRRMFVIATWDGISTTLAPGILARAAREAPGIDFDVRPVPREGSPPGLEDGSLDLSIEVGPRDVPGLKARALYDDDFVCLVRADHPVVGDTLDLATYVKLPHALMSPQGDGKGVVDRCLAQLGLARRVALRIRYFLAAPLVVARSDLVVTAPRALAAGFLGMAPLRMFPPPLELPRVTTSMVWHERAEADPAHRWLREVVVATCGRR